MMIISPAHRLAQVEEYYFSRKLRQIRQMMEEGHDVINLGIGSPDMMPSEATIHELSAVAKQPDGHGYQPYRGLTELRTAIAQWMDRTYRVTLDPEQEILPLMGSKEGITHVSMAFLNARDEVLVPALGYPAYTSVTRMVEGTVRTYPLISDNWQPDFDRMADMDTSRVKIMWCNYPHMPTGTPARQEVLERLVSFARERKILLAHDNPYALLLNRQKPISILSIPEAKGVAIEFHSLSKSHNMAGWRVGWIAGASDYLNEIIKVKSNVDSGMFKAIQLAASRALAEPDIWHAQRNEEYRQRQATCFQLAEALGCRYAPEQQGLFVWAKIPDQEDSAEEFSERLIQRYRVFITPGHIFGAEGARYLRFSLCVPQHRLQEALTRFTTNP